MNKRDRTVLTVLAIVGVLAGFWMLAVKPDRAELTRLDERIASAEQRRDAALADLASAREARTAFRRDRTTLALMGKAVPADDDVPSLLYQLHRAARQTGITFRALNVGDGTAAAAAAAAPAAGAAAQPGLTALPVKLSFTGDFLRMRRFLDTVHGFARPAAEGLQVRGRLLTIDSVDLVPSPAGLPALTAEIAASAYTAPLSGGGAGSAGAASAAATPAAAAATPATPTATSTPSPTEAAE